MSASKFLVQDTQKVSNTRFPSSLEATQLITPKRRKRRLGPGSRIPFSLLIGPVALISLWALGSWLGFIDERVLPAPWKVVTTGYSMIIEGRLQNHVLISAQRALKGLFFGVSIGLVLALISGLSRLGEALIDGPIQIRRAIPIVALIPLFMLWFGIGETMRTFVMTIGVIVPIYIHTHNGLRSIDIRYVELAETLRMSQLDFIRKVVIPGALPGFLLGMRFALTLCWTVLVVVEQINTTAGIGYMIDRARTYGQTDVILVGLVFYGILGLALDSFVRLLGRNMLSWQRTLEG